MLDLVLFYIHDKIKWNIIFFKENSIMINWWGPKLEKSCILSCDAMRKKRPYAVWVLSRRNLEPHQFPVLLINIINFFLNVFVQFPCDWPVRPLFEPTPIPSLHLWFNTPFYNLHKTPFYFLIFFCCLSSFELILSSLNSRLKLNNPGKIRILNARVWDQNEP